AILCNEISEIFFISAMPRALLLFGLLCVQHGESLCLPDAVVPLSRKNLVNNGESYPVGLWPGSWSAATLVTKLAKILIEEKLGFNVAENGPGVDTLSGFYALMGCATPNSLADRGCSKDAVTHNHANLEGWTYSYANTWDYLQAAYPSIAPVNLGNSGYYGSVTMYVASTISSNSYANEGLALSYYRNYNVSWHTPWTYFTGLEAVDRKHLAPCNQTRFYSSSEDMKLYRELTNDADGVAQLPDGTWHAVCPDGFFWLPPGCRSNTSHCIPFFTGGTGWNIEEWMQKSTIWNMPIAVAVAVNWTMFTQLPLMHESSFYWWTPDPTFLELRPQAIVYPFNDEAAWSLGDKRTENYLQSIDKYVSKDLTLLAPNVQELIANFRIDLKALNFMLLENKVTGETMEDTACKWLKDHPGSWEAWLPDDTKCFPGFGLYSTETNTFVPNRQNFSSVVCIACESGRFSKQFNDDKGVTFTCEFCPTGTSQPSGASLSCEPCSAGEYQDEEGSPSCKRCQIGDYQNERGSSTCESCPSGSRTLGLGSVAISDCGCQEGDIDVGEGNLSCVTCSSGLACPPMSSVQSLKSGAAGLGDAYVPELKQGFFSTVSQPLEVYKCGKAIQCPGGPPGSCAGGLSGIPCAECPEGMTWSGGECKQCQDFQRAMWVLSLFAVFGFLTMAYYLLTSKVSGKATILFTTSLAMGMAVTTLQSVGIISMMTVKWPVDLKGIFGWLQIFILDIDSFGFTCLAGSTTSLRYIGSVVFFPVALIWILASYFLSQLLPTSRRWEWAKTLSLMGQFMQVGFSTMSTIALAPLMCYTHPNGQQSILKYPNVICGDPAHTAMLVAGSLLLSVGSCGFVALCTYAAVKVPVWSSREEHKRVQSARFLLFRFRLDIWWYGVPLLIRGPLLSLPIVLATDAPPVQVICVAVVLMMFLCLQAVMWPWKVPLINLLDCWLGFCIILRPGTELASKVALRLSPGRGYSMENG
ncbi:unnamed protein product, partial [Effrenium voratum]